MDIQYVGLMPELISSLPSCAYARSSIVDRLLPNMILNLAFELAGLCHSRVLLVMQRIHSLPDYTLLKHCFMTL